MKEILIQISRILWTVPMMDKNIVICLIGPLKTEQQAMKLLEYLQKNKDNKEFMRIDKLIDIREKIMEEN